MKKIILLVLIVAFTLPVVAQTETSTEKNVLKVNSLSLFLGTGSIFYERNLTPGMSGQLGLGYIFL